MMHPIRVVQLVGGLATDREFGGAELFALRLARNLDRTRFRSCVIGLWRYGRESERQWLETLEMEGIRADLLLPREGRLVTDVVQVFRRLWSVVSHLRPDVINSHSEETDVLNMMLSWLHPLHPRAVRTMHTDQQWQGHPVREAVFLHSMYPFLFDEEIAISESTRRVLDKRLASRLLGRMSTLCYNGVDAALFDTSSVAKRTDAIPAELAQVSPRAGVIGRLTRQKGHRDLIEAVRMVLNEREVHLTIIGSGPLETELRALVMQMGLDKYVHWLGHRSDVLDILPHLDLVISASLWEGFPTVLLEAMALGVPVVATDVSGSRELVQSGQTGILVPPGRPDQLARAIRAILNDPDTAKLMAVCARNRARRFTIENSARIYDRVYTQLVRRCPCVPVAVV